MADNAPLKDLSKNKTISLTTSDAKISHFENSGQILPYLVEDEFKHLNLSTGVLDSSNVPNCRVCDEVRDLDVNWFHYLDKMVADHEAILRSETYNFQECRIPVLSHLNLYFRVLSMGLTSAAHICQRVTNAVSYIILVISFICILFTYYSNQPLRKCSIP